METMKLQNVIYCGDNLDWLRKMPDECVDLIYADPPFFSNKNFEVIWHDGAEIRSFKDRWQGGIYHYIEWMKERCVEIHRVLKPTGSFYLHCDWHAGHYLKVMLDDVFGYKNFQNEVVWAYRTQGATKKRWSRKHDTIFFYTKTSKWYFNYMTERSYMQHKYGFAKDDFKVDEEGKQYRDALVRDVWEIPALQSATKEALGYPTQKPERLLERIIKASSKEGHLVLDPFCGCGTATAVAFKFNRNWLGIDVSPTACKLIKRRLENIKASNVEIIGLPLSTEELKDLEPFEFQNWIVGAMGGTVSNKKVGDMGIDGFTYLNREPIQVKQSEHVGRPIVDGFRNTIERYYENAKKAAKERKDLFFKMKGYIVAFSFTKGLHEEVARLKHEGIEIELLTVTEVVKKLES